MHFQCIFIHFQVLFARDTLLRASARSLPRSWPRPVPTILGREPRRPEPRPRPSKAVPRDDRSVSTLSGPVVSLRGRFFYVFLSFFTVLNCFSTFFHSFFYRFSQGIEDLKLELKSLGRDSLFCFSEEDLRERLQCCRAG